MPTDLPAEQRTRTVRAFFKLCLASSILLCALVLIIYWFHLSARSSYLLALIPIAPLSVAFVGALRKRAAETDPYIRKAYGRAMIGVGVMVAMIVILSEPISGTGILIIAPAPLLLVGILVLTLRMPRRSMWFGDGVDGSLGDALLPVRNKLATPTQNRMYRMAALCIVYVAVSLASRILFDSYTLTGALAYTVALLPVLPLFGFVPIYNKYMAEEQDEFQRLLYRKSTLVAFFGAIIIASAMGGLQEHALISQRAPHLSRPYSRYNVELWINKDLFRPDSPFYFLFIQFEAVRIATLIQARRISAQEKQEKKGQ